MCVYVRAYVRVRHASGMSIRTLARMRARTYAGVEEGGVEVGESAVPGPSESRDESEIDRRRCILLPD